MIKKQFTLTRHVIPHVGRASEAIPFNVPDWTPIWSLPGMSALSPNLAWQWSGVPQLDLDVAQATVAISTNTTQGAKARFRHLPGGTSTWLPFGAEMTQNPGVANPQNISVIVTNEVRAWSNTSGESWENFSIDVLGNGLLFMGCLAYRYEINDYAAEIADLTARLTALESA